MPLLWLARKSGKVTMFSATRRASCHTVSTRPVRIVAARDASPPAQRSCTLYAEPGTSDTSVAVAWPGSLGSPWVARSGSHAGFPLAAAAADDWAEAGPRRV